MKVREIMRTQPWTIDREASLGEAHLLLRAHQIRHLPVVHGDLLVGILSQRDVLGFRAACGFQQSWRTVRVGDVMTPRPQTAHPDDAVTEVAGRLACARIGALPVVERGVLRGIVAVSDVLAAEVQLAMEPAPRVELTAADVMTPSPLSCRPEDSLLELAGRMRARSAHHVPVLDEHDRVVGMLLEHDLRARVRDPWTLARPDTPTLRVRDAMSAAPVTVTADHRVRDLATVFAEGWLHAIPVVDGEARLIGVVSYLDVLRGLAAVA